MDFVREAADPKDEIRIQRLLDAYPRIGELAIRGSENPNLLPKGAITVRLHSVGGWGAVTTGKNLAMTLYDLLGFDIKANPKYGSEKKGQPTTYYLSAAPEPIRLNCEYTYVDVVMSPDPNVFSHSNPLSGLNKGGSFIIQSYYEDPAEVWASFPPQARKTIVDNEIRVFFMDGFKIAREEASDPELQYRMQGNAFQGAFFAASPLMERAGLTEAGLFKAIEEQLRHKFGGKGERVVQDNLRVVRRGFDEVTEILDKPLGLGQMPARKAPTLPVMLKRLPEGEGGISDVHRFWEQTGVFYASGRGNDNLVDPHMALSLMPASTGVYRDMTQIRFEYPKYVPENCTACGNCFTVCPDSAIPGLVNSVSDVFATAIQRVERGMPTQHLRREVRTVEKRLRELIEAAGESADMRQLMDQAVLETLAAYEGDADQKGAVEQEFGLMMEALGDYQFAITKPYWTNREKKQKGTGGLFSITVNPYTCKGCMECVEVCDDDALVSAPQTTETIKEMQSKWAIWLDLPTTDPGFIRIDDLDEKVGALETLLLDKSNYESVVAGDGSCMGCGEKTVIHLFTATVTALMQPRVKAHLAEIDDLIGRLETHVRLKLAAAVDLSNTAAISKVIEGHKDTDLTLSDLSAELDPGPHRRARRSRVAALGDRTPGQAAPPQGPVHQGPAAGRDGHRQRHRVLFGVGLHLSLQPLSLPLVQPPVPGFALHRPGSLRGAHAQDGGGLQGHPHGAAGAGGQVQRRRAARVLHLLRLEAVQRRGVAAVPAGGGGRRRRGHVRHRLPEPVPGPDLGAPGEDPGARHPGLLQYRRSGLHLGLHRPGVGHGPYGKVWKGKTELRKEMALIGMAHRTSFVLSSAISHMTHLLEGYIDGLNARRPALFNIYAACQPEHGIGDDMSSHHSSMAVESRAYPLFRFDPDAGETFEECCSIEGNPAIEKDWLDYTIKYTNEKGEEAP